MWNIAVVKLTRIRRAEIRGKKNKMSTKIATWWTLNICSIASAYKNLIWICIEFGLCDLLRTFWIIWFFWLVGLIWFGWLVGWLFVWLFFCERSMWCFSWLWYYYITFKNHYLKPLKITAGQKIYVLITFSDMLLGQIFSSFCQSHKPQNLLLYESHAFLYREYMEHMCVPS